MPTPLYIPPDIAAAYEKYKANCGPIALAAFAEKPVGEVLPHFGRDWPGYTNATKMKFALRSLGYTYEVLPSRRTPATGLIWIELVGPWSAPGLPVGAQLAHSHWICKRGPQIFDPITEDWRDTNHWECSVAEEWIKTTNRATGWRVRTGLEVCHAG